MEDRNPLQYILTLYHKHHVAPRGLARLIARDIESLTTNWGPAQSASAPSNLNQDGNTPQ